MVFMVWSSFVFSATAVALVLRRPKKFMEVDGKGGREKRKGRKGEEEGGGGGTFGL